MYSRFAIDVGRFDLIAHMVYQKSEDEEEYTKNDITGAESVSFGLDEKIEEGGLISQLSGWMV